MKYIMLVFLTMTLFLSSCHKSIVKDENDIKLSLKSGSDIPEGLSMGVYVNEKDKTVYDFNEASNIQMTYLSKEAILSQEIFLTGNNSYHIFSYSPYISTVSSPYAIPFNFNEDILYAKGTLTNISKGNNSISLTYNHRCSQITFEVVIDSHFDANGDGKSDSTSVSAKTKLIVGGFFKEGSLDILSGNVTPDTESILDDLHFSSSYDSEKKVYTLITPPMNFMVDTSAESSEISLTGIHAGIEIKGVISKKFTLGTSYKYTVTLAHNTLYLGSTVIDWQEKGSEIETY